MLAARPNYVENTSGSISSNNSDIAGLKITDLIIGKTYLITITLEIAFSFVNISSLTITMKNGAETYTIASNDNAAGGKGSHSYIITALANVVTFTYTKTGSSTYTWVSPYNRVLML